MAAVPLPTHARRGLMSATILAAFLALLHELDRRGLDPSLLRSAPGHAPTIAYGIVGAAGFALALAPRTWRRAVVLVASLAAAAILLGAWSAALLGYVAWVLAVLRAPIPVLARLALVLLAWLALPVARFAYLDAEAQAETILLALVWIGQLYAGFYLVVERARELPMLPPSPPADARGHRRGRRKRPPPARPPREEPQRAEPQRAEPQRAEPQKGEPRHGEPRRGELRLLPSAKARRSNAGAPRRGERKPGEPHQREPGRAGAGADRAQRVAQPGLAGVVADAFYLLALPRLVTPFFQPISPSQLARCERSDPPLPVIGRAAGLAGYAAAVAVAAGVLDGLARELEPAPLAIAVRFLGLYARATYTIFTAVAVFRLLGWHLPSGYRTPFLSSSFAEFFRRYNYYVRDAVLSLFYYPLLGRLRHSMSPRAASIVSAYVAILFGSFLLHDLLVPLSVTVEPFSALGYFADPVRLAGFAIMWTLIIVPTAGIAPRREPPRSRSRTLLQIIAFNVVYLALWYGQVVGRGDG